MSHCPQCFSFQPGRQGLWCNPCRAALMRRTRKRYCQLSPEERKKSNARAYANSEQRRGKISPVDCQRCGNPKAQKHHPDYSKPLKVIWLCRKCHNLIHREETTKQFLQFINNLTR